MSEEAGRYLATLELNLYQHSYLTAREASVKTSTFH